MSLGGVDTFLFRLGRSLQDRGCHVEILTTEGDGPWFPLAQEKGLQARSITRSVLGGWIQPLKIARELGRADYDIVFVNHAKYAQAALGMLPDRVAVVPIVHNDLDFVYRVAAVNANAWNVAVCVSPGVLRKFTTAVPGRPSVCITCGVEVPEGRLAARKEDDKIRLVFIGRLEHAQKGVLMLPEIVRKCREQGANAELVVVGTGADEDRLRIGFRESGVEDSVTLLGGLRPEGIYNVLLESDILLMPSFFEGLGLVLLEAMACGCVPVASRLEGITDSVIDDGVDGCLPAVGDVDGFAHAITTLAVNTQRRRKMAAAARQKIAASFSVEIMGRAYWTLIRDLLAGRYPLARPRRTQWPDLPLILTWKDFLPTPCLSGLRSANKISRRLLGLARS
jgi:glycosyltransferase involved in cell wall biosynthesis